MVGLSEPGGYDEQPVSLTSVRAQNRGGDQGGDDARQPPDGQVDGYAALELHAPARAPQERLRQHQSSRDDLALARDAAIVGVAGFGEDRPVRTEHPRGGEPTALDDGLQESLHAARGVVLGSGACDGREQQRSRVAGVVGALPGAALLGDVAVEREQALPRRQQPVLQPSAAREVGELRRTLLRHRAQALDVEGRPDRVGELGPDVPPLELTGASLGKVGRLAVDEDVVPVTVEGDEGLVGLVEDLAERLTQVERRDVGEQGPDPSGSQARSWVPPPGPACRVRVPPASWTRSRIPTRPRCPGRSANPSAPGPVPSSTTVSDQPKLSSDSVMTTNCASAWRATLESASAAMR